MTLLAVWDSARAPTSASARRPHHRLTTFSYPMPSPITTVPHYARCAPRIWSGGVELQSPTPSAGSHITSKLPSSADSATTSSAARSTIYFAFDLRARQRWAKKLTRGGSLALRRVSSPRSSYQGSTTPVSKPCGPSKTSAATNSLPHPGPLAAAAAKLFYVSSSEGSTHGRCDHSPALSTSRPATPSLLVDACRWPDGHALWSRGAGLSCS